MSTITFQVLVLWTLNLAFTFASLNKYGPIQFQRVAALNDNIFTGDVSFDLQGARSKIECADLCVSKPGCLSFTFYDKVKCRGHSAVMTTTKNNVAWSGAETYIAGWSNSFLSFS
jgi:hypothetical protein